jgi:hypothetical protein
VRGAISSARTRRRLFWLGGLILAGGVVAGLVFAFPSPGSQPGSKISTQKAETIAQQKETPFGPKKGEVQRTAMAFVRTAVTRHDIGASYDLVAPSLKKGYTRAHWAAGNDLPVPEYPAIMAISRLMYSFSNEVDLQIALFAHRGQLRPVVFDITLDRVRMAGHPHWLVASFLPTPSDGGGVGQRLNRANLFGAPTPKTAGTSRVWLLIPAAFFTLLLLVLAGLGIRSWHGGRLYRAYARQD